MRSTPTLFRAMRLAVPLLAPTFAACATTMPVETQVKAPELVARDFYGWYIGLMAHDKEATDEPRLYARYVSRALRTAIARRIASPDGMDADYFVKAQDYSDDWVGHVTARPGPVRGPVADIMVMLGRGGKPWRLAVRMIREDGVWKVAGVTRR